MPSDTIYKTIQQYNKEPVPAGDMKKLQEIADDYKKVKNYVYERYGGIGNLSKLYPGYTVQNEMTDSGLRQSLDLPSVYFYLAVFDALGDIKSQWTRTKARVQKQVSQNEGFTPEEKHYLRFLLKVNNTFTAVLNQLPIELPDETQLQYEELAGQVDRERLHRYLCRQVRKYHVKQHTDTATGFAVTERAYRYADHGIWISTKEKRKRIFIPLTDKNQYKSQIYIKLFPENNRVEIKVPVNVAVHTHRDYSGRIGLSAGMQTMLTTDRGHSYGDELWKYHAEYADWIRMQTGIYNQNRSHNPGRKKYYAKKRRLEEQMHSYINHEINRLLQIEKPQIIYMAKLPSLHSRGISRKINNYLAIWQRGYIRSRLMQKCRKHSVEFTEVWGKDISKECCCCGAVGNKTDGLFICGLCGYCADIKVNTAQNALLRGTAGSTPE